MKTYQAKIPNGAKVIGYGGVGHIDPAGGGPRNNFGLAFVAASYVWTNALCNADSDGDGFSNGVDLLDPLCVSSSGNRGMLGHGRKHPRVQLLQMGPTFSAPSGFDPRDE